jgi:hypothetical protein
MQLRTSLTAMVVAGSAAALLFAGGSALASTSAVHPASTTGQEVISHVGHETWPQATKPGELLPLILTGVVKTRGAIALGGHSQTRPITTRAGRLEVKGNNLKITNKVLNAATCRLQTTVTDDLTVLGNRSTGKFAGASGTGKSVVIFAFNYPKANGKCHFNEAGKSKTGHVKFSFVIPSLTVK